MLVDWVAGSVSCDAYHMQTTAAEAGVTVVHRMRE